MNDKMSGDYRKISIIDSATKSVETDGESNETVKGRFEDEKGLTKI